MIDTLEKLRRARHPRDVFGDVDLEEGRRIYLALVRALHPDRHPDQQHEATEAMQLVNSWWPRFKDTHGNGNGAPVVITRGHKSYTIVAPLAAGEIADLHDATDERGTAMILKIVRDPADNDLMRNEQGALTKIAAAGLGDMRVVYPDLIDSFMMDGRAVTVLKSPALVSLQQISEAFPGGIDARDMVWMWKRALGAVGLAHKLGLVHGALLPTHVLIDVHGHGAHLVGWTASAAAGGKIRLKSTDYRTFYPPEAPTASPQLDLYMLAQTMISVTRALPDAMKRTLEMCCQESAARRPRSALVLHEIVDQVAIACFGPRKFREFTLPKTGGNHG